MKRDVYAWLIMEEHQPITFPQVEFSQDYIIPLIGTRGRVLLKRENDAERQSQGFMLKSGPDSGLG